MTADYQKKLERNIVKYAWYKIFTKRLYLPLIAIQLVNVGKVTLEEIALIAIITSVVQALLQMPAGYFADKFGNRRSIILGASIAVISPLFYIFMPNFWGGLLASVLFFGSYAFQSGSIEAFIHDTLIALKKEKQYSRVMGKAQSYGLLGNVVLIALVPATYAIDHSLPFWIGFVSLLAMLWLTVSFTYPDIPETHKEPKSPFNALRSIVTAQNVTLFIFAGFAAGISNKGGEFRELLFQDIGVAVSLFGIILAVGSLLGAVFGWWVHILDKLKPLTFYLLDLIIMSGCLIVAGLTRDPLIVLSSFTIFAAYTRVRMIIFQAKLLNDITHAYKATLISALNLFNVIGDTAVVTILASTVSGNGYSVGHVLFGLSVFGIGLILWLGMVAEARQRRRASTT